jgi:hypothetical protein
VGGSIADSSETTSRVTPTLLPLSSYLNALEITSEGNAGNERIHFPSITYCGSSCTSDNSQNSARLSRVEISQCRAVK